MINGHNLLVPLIPTDIHHHTNWKHIIHVTLQSFESASVSQNPDDKGHENLSNDLWCLSSEIVAVIDIPLTINSKAPTV